jgi:hypothetical protein
MCVYVIYLNIYIFNLDILVTSKAYVCVKIGFYLEKLPVVAHREL